MTNFSFIVDLVTLYSLFHPLAGAIDRLQQRTTDIMKAYEEITTIKHTIIEMQETVEINFYRIYLQANRLAVDFLIKPKILPKVSLIKPTMPGTAKR